MSVLPLKKVKTGALIRQQHSMPVRCCKWFIKFLIQINKPEKP
jgi:hypothetical protein